MKKHALLGGVAAIAFFAAASDTNPAVAQQPHNWTGFYVGGHIGHAQAEYRGGFELQSSTLAAGALDLSDFGGGVHGGFNWQVASMFGPDEDLVIGIEGDATFFDISDDNLGSDDGITGELELLASVRGRLGIAFDRFLVFATGGIAIPDASYTVISSGGAASFEFDDIGGVFGGGVEFAATEMVSFRGEILYYIFNDKHDTSSPFGGTGDFAELENTVVFRLGVTVHLGGLMHGIGP